MKVEKCPRCDYEPLMANCYQAEWVLGIQFDRLTGFYLGCGCHHEDGTFKLFAKLKWNRWARRERRKGAVTHENS